MLGALAIVLKRPPLAVRLYAAIQVISCAYYGLYENSASETEYRIAYILITVVATTLAGLAVACQYASKRTILIGLGLGFTAFAILPASGLDGHILLVQACGALTVGVPLASKGRELIPGTLGALFLSLTAFWFGYLLLPEWRDHWDWIAPVWMHTAAYSWLGWKLKWSDSSLSRPTRPVAHRP